MQPTIKTIGLERFLEFNMDADLLSTVKAYYDVGWYQRGINIIRDSGASFPIGIYQGDEPVYSTADDNLDETPDAVNILYLLDEMITDLYLYGRFYAVYESNAYGFNGKWRRLQPTTITPDVDKTGLKGFKRSLGKIDTEQRYYKPDELLYIWTPCISAELGYGEPLGQSALRSATTLDNINKFQSAFFEQGALSPTLVSMPGFAQQPKEEQGRIMSLFKRLWSGRENAHKIHPIDGDVSATVLQQSLEQMAMDNLTTQRREDVATALGVPQSLLFSQATSFATATQDDLNFYDKTVIPLLTLIFQQVNERLMLPNGYRMKLHKQELEVYQQMEAQKAERLNGMLDRNVITVDEYREMMGLPERQNNELEPQVIDADIQDRLTRLEQPRNDDTQEESAEEELRTWQRYASKRFKEGNPEKAASFTCEIVPPELAQNVKATLQLIEDVNSVSQVFTDAQNWLAYSA